MSCPCKELEREHGDGGCKCSHYREAFPDCECEAHSVGEGSPGVVQDDELLVRVLYSPHHINKETGEATPMAFKDAQVRGLSVQRMAHISEEEHLTRIERKVAEDRAAHRKNDGFWRVIVARCGDIRGLRLDNGRRVFCAYDTSREDDTAHADVCQAHEYPKGTANREWLHKKMRHGLFEVFAGGPTDLATAYARAGARGP